MSSVLPMSGRVSKIVVTAEEDRLENGGSDGQTMVRSGTTRVTIALSFTKYSTSAVPYIPNIIFFHVITPVHFFQFVCLDEKKGKVSCTQLLLFFHSTRSLFLRRILFLSPTQKFDPLPKFIGELGFRKKLEYCVLLNNAHLALFYP